MIVVDEPLAAQPAEVADPAVVAGPRIRVVPTIERGEEPLAYATVVRLELGDAKRLALAAAVLDVDALDGRALDPRDLLGVEAELQDVRRLRRPRELRVDRLVPPVGLPFEEVRESSPAPVLEVRLVDDVREADPDRLLGQPPGLVLVERLVVVGRDADDRAALGLEPREVRRLVLLPLPEDQVAMRRVQVRALELSPHDTDRERRQVRAGEVRREVGG